MHRFGAFLSGSPEGLRYEPPGQLSTPTWLPRWDPGPEGLRYE